MSKEPPKIDARAFSDLLRALRQAIPHYTPEWPASDEKDPAVGLLKIFSRMTENIIGRLNGVSHKNFAAFLNMLGIELLPARPARVPLTFTLAKGTEREVLVPARTQAAAGKTEEHEELPFETETNLLAVPSALTRAIAVDPASDTVYEPPPGFLEGTLKNKPQLSYLIVSAPSAGARDFQFDHVTDLQKGDYLRIGDEKRPEYVIISKISGTIVTITDPLASAYPVNTPVVKVTRFALFEGKNLQEHGLYLSHKDLFNVKSTAIFTATTKHRAGTDAGVTPLEMSWEYWGEVKGEEGEGWHAFETVDGTNGMSDDGGIDLHKATEGEIKEKEINGLKGRWVRCLLREPLSVGTPRKLPVLDSISFTVSSAGAGLTPDQAFNNDTPLDMTRPFSPFGKEPRIYDNFTLASKDAFSKKGAQILIDTDMEPRGIVGSPTAVWVRPLIMVFAVGSYGRLIEIDINSDTGEQSDWIDHGFPEGTRLAAESAPDAAAWGSFEGRSGNIAVFARSEAGHLVERFYNGAQWQWLDHGLPGDNVLARFSPAGIYGNDTVGNAALSAFVTGSDGTLHVFQRDPDSKSSGEWRRAGNPADTTVTCSPYAFKVREGSADGIALKVFVGGETGRLYGLDYDARTTKIGNWTDYGQPGDDVAVDSRPLGWTSPDGSHVRVYVKGADNNTWEFDNNLTPSWKKLSGPLTVGSDPHGYINLMSGPVITMAAFQDEVRVLVRGIDGALWEYDGTQWTSRGMPPNALLTFSPFTILAGDSTGSLHTFSASNRNAVIGFRSDRNIWNEYADPDEGVLVPTLSWEYWNSKGWIAIEGIEDGTNNLLKTGRIAFTLPWDIDETTVSGQKNFWIRARIIGGDYGKETFSLSLRTFDETASRNASQQLISTKNTIRPPLVRSIAISYSIRTSLFPERCIAYNNLEYRDQTDPCQMPDKHFSPFVELEDRQRSLYLGFDKAFQGGPVKILLDAQELPYAEDKKPKVEWTYSEKSAWQLLDALDNSEGLIRRELIELIGPVDFAAQSRFGSYLDWLKGSLIEGEYAQTPVLEGIYPNTVWTSQAATIRNEILGSGTGQADQIFTFLKTPVLEVEEVRVLETVPNEEKQALSETYGDNAVFEVKDDKGKVTETWILWTKVSDFFDSTPTSRHYTLDRATGEIRFGNGINGMAPPEGKDDIKAFSYQSGGGAKGNVNMGEIKTLKSSVAGVDKVSNQVAADGGADTATLDQMMEIGPAMVSHRNRAVTAEDFEWLAKQATRKVARAKCLPNTNSRLQAEIGWVTVIVVPDSKDIKPVPSLELRSIVSKYLEACTTNTIASPHRVHVDGPAYVDINVSADVFVPSIDMASQVEREARSRLVAFFHPLTGGPEQRGWDFGREIHISDIYALLEGINGVDHVENLTVNGNGTAGEGSSEFRQYSLPAGGTHTINMRLSGSR